MGLGSDADSIGWTSGLSKKPAHRLGIGGPSADGTFGDEIGETNPIDEIRQRTEILKARADILTKKINEYFDRSEIRGLVPLVSIEFNDKITVTLLGKTPDYDTVLRKRLLAEGIKRTFNEALGKEYDFTVKAGYLPIQIVFTPQREVSPAR